MQDGEPGVFAKVPVVQFEQLIEYDELAVPGGQIIGGFVASGHAYPAGHIEQVLLPASGANIPVGHGVQSSNELADTVPL